MLNFELIFKTNFELDFFKVTNNLEISKLTKDTLHRDLVVSNYSIDSIIKENFEVISLPILDENYQLYNTYINEFDLKSNIYKSFSLVQRNFIYNSFNILDTSPLDYIKNYLTFQSIIIFPKSWDLVSEEIKEKISSKIEKNSKNSKPIVVLKEDNSEKRDIEGENLIFQDYKKLRSKCFNILINFFIKKLIFSLSIQLLFMLMAYLN